MYLKGECAFTIEFYINALRNKWVYVEWAVVSETTSFGCDFFFFCYGFCFNIYT
jgi:hypothetical protein